MKALSDEYIEKCIVSGQKEHNQTILLVDYDERWPFLFERERKRISDILKEKALMIEHIGSTSVMGLCAKPIIDILLVVEDAGREEDYMEALCQYGYVLRIKEPDFEDHHMFKGVDTDINLHVFSKGSKEIDKYLIFRDYLRSIMRQKSFMKRRRKNLRKRNGSMFRIMRMRKVKLFKRSWIGQ